LNPQRQGKSGKKRLAVIFALLLCGVVVAGTVVSPPPALSEASEEEAAPSEQALAEATAKAEEEAAREREERETPAAEREREESATAYTSLSAAEAQALLQAAFPGQLEELNGDPARVLSTLEIEKPLGTYAALVEAGEGESAILNSSVPVQSEVAGEGMEPVDLTLERSGSSFVPRNPITEVELPGSAEASIQLQGGVEVELPASDDHGAEPLGEMNLFYPETETATDTLIAPKAGGVEVFEQLRSPESPERFSFPLNLPKEATLRPSEAGGAEILSSSDHVIEEVPPPTATDAQGAPVPVTTSVEGDSLILEVPHRSREVAYPVLLDPAYVTDATSFGEWGPTETAEYSLGNSGWLSAISKGHHWYGANTYGQWAYGAYGSTAYIYWAEFSPVNFYVHTCSNAQPHGYIGIYNVNSGSYEGHLGIYSGGDSSSKFVLGPYENTGNRYAVVGIGTAASGIEIGCAHELWVGGTTIEEKDPEAPTVNSVTGIPSGWTREITVTPHASDPGLGVKGITLHPNGASPQPLEQGCNGANGSRCPGSWETSFGVSYFLEGERSAEISAYDPLGPDVASHVSSSYKFTTRLDRQKPEVELEGEFTEALEEAKEEGEGKNAPALHLPVYNLKIEASDGNPKGEPKDWRSGVKDIAVFLDGKEMKVPWEAQGCSGPEYSCPMVKTYPVPLDEVQGGGVHHLKVIATDQVGNERELEREFEYFPATGMKDEYVMQHFPLPDGKDHSEEEEYGGPELAVNVTNGNLVFHQKDVEVNGPGVDLEVERFYNSQLPEEDNTEWGDGWTLAQTPKLEPEETKEEAPPAKASMVRTSGVLESTVGLPAESGASQFDKKLQAVVTKEPSGYTVEDQSGETDTSLAFDEAGKVQELQTPGYAKIDYSYEEGDLTEMAVKDPATTPAPKPQAEAPTYQSSLGSEGAEAGKLKHPADLAIDAERNIWVADYTNNRVEEFDGAGNFVKAFGWGVSNGESKLEVCTASCQAGLSGSGNGQLNRPAAIAIDPEGNLWVADKNNYRIEEFNPKGEYLAKFGTLGSGNGQFFYPEGIAIDAEGNIWVADSILSRVQEFNPKGEFVKVVATEGTGNGQVKAPAGLAIDAEGNLWIADKNNNRVEELNEAGEFIRQWKGSGPAAFKPFAIDVDQSGTVWVADTEHNRVEAFNPYGDLLTSFGEEGSGEGQLKLSAPVGLAADPFGRIWVADAGNNRVQRWLANQSVKYDLTYQSSLGSEGAEAGKLKHPADLAIDAERNIWVADYTNNRVEEFDGAGNFVKAFGWGVSNGESKLEVCTASCQAGLSGSGNGQLNRPAAIAIDPEGNLWVADKNNYRIEEFNPKGEYLAKFGTLGSGNGQFFYPEGIAIDAEGNIWVADSILSRVQEFNPKGEFVKVVATEGTGNGQVKAPAGLAIDAEGNLWIADKNNNRVEELNEAGEFIRQWKGSGPAAFKPFAIDVDQSGTVWVADTEHNRVEAFNPYGDLLTSFGEEGSGEGQLKLSAPVGLAADLIGDVWAVDAGNNRIQQWIPSEELPPAPEAADPSVEVELAGGLVSKVEGEEAGTTTYSHSGELLTAANGSDGETEYQYDSEEHLTKVTLPNGTWGEVVYDFYGRVESVTVSAEGKSKTTIFTYKDEPRRTTVSAEEEPATVYDIAPDGSVLKWWNTEVPPEIENLSGSLYANRETVQPIEPGDYELLVQAFSGAGIASIEVVANGNQLVDEKTCEKSAETDCKTVEDPWVTETANWPPGILQLEVIATDSNGQTESAKFWVNIPYTPPPDPEAEEPPTFEEVLHFREEFGLDLDLKGNEIAIDERIFNLIGAWYNPQTPAGEVARATDERWGVPLRAVDAAELEYRAAYQEQASTAIPTWVESHAASTYAGYYLDERAGGIIRVGFTSNQAAMVEQLRSEAGLMAPSRMEPFTYQPTRSIGDLNSLQNAVTEASTEAGSPPQIFSVDLDLEHNGVKIGTAEVSQTNEYMNQKFGQQEGLTAYFEANAPAELAGRYQAGRPFLAGEEIQNLEHLCTAGFGAWSRVGTKPNGDPIKHRYVLTAGHCFPLGTGLNAAEIVYRARYKGDPDPVQIGTTERRGFLGDPNRFDTDAEAIHLEDPNLVPGWIYECCGGRVSIRPTGVAYPKVGEVLCQSGVNSNAVFCGPVLGEASAGRLENATTHQLSGWHWMIHIGAGGEPGDSGSPVWVRNTGEAVGLVIGGGSEGLAVQPFIRPPNAPTGQIAGVLSDPRMSPSAKALHVQLGP